jgi:hypothetical protein
MNEALTPEEFCAQSKRVDGQRHTWRFDGDSPVVFCHWCGEQRDALTGKPLRTLDAARASSLDLATLREAAQRVVDYAKAHEPDNRQDFERLEAALATPAASSEAAALPGDSRPDVDLDELSAWAVRYALGRATYAVHNVCDVIERRRDALRPETRAVIVRDIDHYASRVGRIGMEIDHDRWMRLRAALDPAAPREPTPDTGGEYGRLLAKRDRLIADGVDPADLDVPERP